MKIGIIGSGEVGQTLAGGFLDLGHEVCLGSREPGSDKMQEWFNSTDEKGTTDDFENTAKFGEIIIVATKWDGVQNALKMAKPENLAGKLVIDVTNPLDFSTGKPALALGFNTSGGEKIQEWLPSSMVVKTLNIIGSKLMIQPKFEVGTPDMLLCGNDPAAKEKTRKILEDFGWTKITDLGEIEGARLMEPLCLFWISYCSINGNWNSAISMLQN